MQTQAREKAVSVTHSTSQEFKRGSQWILSTILLLLVAGCGGSGSGGGSGGGGGSDIPLAAKVSADSLAQICTAGSTFAIDASRPTRTGTYLDEQKWLYAYLSERYLWYKDMPKDVQASDPVFNIYSSVGRIFNYGQSITNYFFALLNPNHAASGKLVDEFSFLTRTRDWNSYANSQELGYGFAVSTASAGSADGTFISYVYPGSNAQKSGFMRGDSILSIDGISSTDTAHTTAFNAALNPTSATSHTFVIERNDGTHTIEVTAATETLKQVEYKVLANGQKSVGYLLFNSHVPAAESDLLAAFQEFKNRAVDELVIDLRYNGGGYLYLASGLAYSVAGAAATQGKAFETLTYNDKRTQENYTFPFYDTNSDGVALPSLNLKRAYVLASSDTCSASEAVVNSLRGVGVDVQLIGSTTCGKPYGFSAQDNCGVTFAAMEFVGTNARGDSVNPDGMTPDCQASDDLGHELGNTSEGMLSVALRMQLGNSCTQAQQARALGSVRTRGLAIPGGGKLLRPSWKSNKFVDVRAR